MLARELIKDAEDVEGDRAGGAVTVPIRIGIKKTSLIAIACSGLAVAFSFVPFLWWGIWYIAGIIPVDCIILAAVFRAFPCDTPGCLKTSCASVLLKAGFFASLVVFAVSAIILRIQA
jgi:geranylgeranylglycerol-phosphate geranylgeranyltransferase